ncbi:cobaltochelatase subunit CobN [Variovorax sp. NFACC27]|uniref:cobaltochelatase subunit CobN n=1 Tax=unclassified Variovorax TaxID=663243 RepID=UPI0008955230|nr:cobaltochelatase CobN [Variovorax sp. NFACC28]SEG82347.1 cobaltochelatase CobN [Variovorax sp. NFACC29]SFD07741.1 cobaltochelatase CobN [Variovorax sp. NFACC26]SFG19705.1 cobaltochelatase CobN [Variovorax sp. NFACC27]
MTRVFLFWLLAALGFVAPAQAHPAGGRVVVLSTSLVSPARVMRLQAAAREAGLPLQVVSASRDSPEALAGAVEGASLLVVDAPHISVAQAAAARFGDVISRGTVPYVLVGEFALVAKGQASTAAPLAAERGVDAAWAQRLREYWRFPGAANLGAAMKAMAQPGKADGLPDPVPMPLAGLYHPAWPRIETGVPAIEGLAGSGTVAIAINSATVAGEDTGWLDALIASLERRGLRAYAFYGPRQQKDLFFRMTHDGERRVADVIVNASLVFSPNERKAELERIGVPVLQTLPSLAMDADQWARSRDGLAQTDIASYYSPSELAGMTDPMLVSARDGASGTLQPLPAQIDAVAAKAAALLRLQRTPPADRRVAMLVYNYPPGEANFGASFLNVPRSVSNMLAAMKSAGYGTELPGTDALIAQVQATMKAYYPNPTGQGDELQPLLDRGLADTLPLPAYLAWFRALPQETQRRIESYWGPPEKSTMLRPVAGEPAFVIPRVRFGNVVVLRQPPRFEPGTQVAGKAEQVYHRSAVPLSHGYLATYLWLRTRFGAGAVVHVGTHGTVEWSAGKERGLSVQDDPLLALGDLPNVYPFIMDNLGEATTAKRRGRATMVSHSTPLFAPAGFRPGVQEMHERMHEWETLSPGSVKTALERRLAAEFAEHRYDRDLGWTPARIRADFAGFIAVLHPYLDELAQTAQPLGLATFGQAPDAQRRRMTILQILGKPLVEALGEDIDEAFLIDARSVAGSRPARWVEQALTDAQAASAMGATPADRQKLLELAQRARKLDDVLAHNEEIEGLLTALDGRYLKSSYGGDPVRNPDSLPTGRNLYGFDPSRVPTRAAWETGVAAMDAWIAEHAKTHAGKAPQKIAFTLWAGEASRHQGVLESQAFYAMGVKPRWDEGGRMAGIEIIPALQLKRPRIDVLVSVTGSYRDQFPAVMRWLDEAVQQVVALREPGNAVAGNSETMARRLRAEGATASEAQRWSTARVFSNEQGSYGAGLEEAALASEVWKNQQRGGGDAQMAQLYMDRMGHAYGKGLDGAVRPGAYAGNLVQVDAALMARSSNLYGVLTNDDPFQYLGGIAQAVRHLTGKDPALYVQNLRDGSAVRTDTAAGAIAREMQTRYLHPQWIEAQKAEGYSGTLQVLKTAQFLWGWQVTAPAAVRQDQWQSLHDVYVRDRYRLGTREWLEGDNRAAFAQTLERMLDAVRLDYWSPDAATRRELARAYAEAVRATGLRERNAGVQRFAQAELSSPASPVPRPRPPIAPVVVATPAPEPVPNESPAQDGPQPVSGLKLEPTPAEAPSPQAESVVFRLWVALGAALLVAFGALMQWRRGRAVA